MGLRDTYAYAIQQAKGKFDGSAEEREGKLYWKGTVKSEQEANEIWAAIKTIPTWRNDVVADIKVTGGGSGGGVATAARRSASFDWAMRAVLAMLVARVSNSTFSCRRICSTSAELR